MELHCHWALHVDLTLAGTTKHFLKAVDNFVIGLVGGLKTKGERDFTAETNTLWELGKLERFRAELKKFFSLTGIKTDLCDDDNLWFAFLRSYGRVIEDGTLSAKYNRRLMTPEETPLEVEKVVFSKGRPPAGTDLFTVKWIICL